MNGMLRRICQRNFCTCSPRPWLFVGLGNPGDKYKGTRHNVGFEMLDAFADSQGIHMETIHCKAMFGNGVVNGIPVLLAKPLTYMNLSGESSASGHRIVNMECMSNGDIIDLPVQELNANASLVSTVRSRAQSLLPLVCKIGPLAAYYKLPLNRVVVFHDDMDLPCGVLRLHPKGDHQKHNGLKSVIYHFHGNGEFPRLRIGIGRPPGQMDPKAFMLQKFNLAARERIDAALLEGAHALEQVISKGFSESSKCFNKKQKYKHIRLQTMPV